MPVVTIRLDHHVHRELKLRAASNNLSISALVRPLVEEAAFPGGRYVYTSQDEVLGVAVQTFALLAELARVQAPDALRQGISSARSMLRERGLLPPDVEPFVGAGTVAATHSESPR